MTINTPSAIFRTFLIVLVALAQAVCVCGHAAAVTEQPQHSHRSAAHSCCDEHGTSHDHSEHHSHSTGDHADGCQHCVGVSFVKPAAVDLVTPAASAVPDLYQTAKLVETFATWLHITHVTLRPTSDRPPQHVLFRRTVILLV